jgi:hypothetical protein
MAANAQAEMSILLPILPVLLGAEAMRELAASVSEWP